MTIVNVQQTDFTGGEISPKLYGRSDLQAYFSGARRMENFVPQTQGPAIFRGGFHFIAETRNNQKAFLYKFQFSDERSYVLEFTNLNIRIYRNRGVVLDSGSPVDVTAPYLESELFELKFAQNATDLYIVHPNHQPRILTRSSDTSWTLSLHSPTGLTPSFASQPITNITQANPGVVTYTGADTFANGERIRIDGVVGMTEVNGNYYTVANLNAGANTFELEDTDTSGFTAYTSDGTLFNADNVPAAVGLYEQRLIYGGSNALPETLWFSESGNFDNFTVGTNATDPLQYTIATGGDVNKVEWIRGNDSFLAIGGFGDLLRASGSELNEAISPTSISIKPTNTFGVADQNPISKRQKIFYMQRNQRTLLSLELNNFSGNYEPVDRNLLADHITSSGVTQIAYKEARPDVLLCTKTDGELIGATIEKQQEAASDVTISGWHRYPTDGEVVSVATVPRVLDFDDVYVCVKRNINGTDRYYIEYLNDNIEFQRREDFVLSDSKSNDLLVFQRALFETQKQYIHVDSALSFDGSQRGLDAGASLTIGAVSGSGVTFTASTSVFDFADVGRQVWIKSTDGTRFGRATIVSFISASQVTCDITINFDSVTAYDAGNWYITTNTVSGLDHLEGETVKVVTDGAIHPDRTVSGNSISLEADASVVHVGLQYTGTIESNDLEGGGTTGPVQTKKKTVYKLGLRLLDTLGIRFGSDYYNLEDRLLRKAVDLMDNPPPLFTGDETVRFEDGANNEDEGGWSRSKRIIIQQTLALPAAVQLIVPYVNVTNND